MNLKQPINRQAYHLTLKVIFTLCFFITSIVTFGQDVQLIEEVKISDKGLFFDGQKVGKNEPNNGPRYDYIFGSRITPHGDCIKVFGDYVFMTWYRGGKNDRHVMLSRYNKKTGVTKTIEFPHRHNGFQNKVHLGESHNTIAVGICPIDGTIHLLYDMHSYSENRPSDGSLRHDYFRYSYSKKNAAKVSDAQFNLSQFVQDNPGDYKHLKMRSDENYKSLTYPNFFLNKKGELFMWIREGGNNNGAYKFCKYDGTKWTKFTQFNILNAKSKGLSYNWGLYGDIKFESGKMRIGFHIRSNNNNDKYELNSGFYYGYSDDPNGLNQWKDHAGKGFSLPLIDPDKIKISEPGNVVSASGKNSVKISRGADWTVTERGDIHFVSTVSGGGQRKNVHTYKKAGDTNFKTSTSFPGGNLYTYNNEVYLIGLSGGRVFVEKADGGTNNWTNIYKATSGKKFRHGNVYIEDGKIYFYMMEQKSGSAQPIYLQILDLGLDQQENQAPSITLTSPSQGQEFTLGETITLSANASDSDGSIDKVNFKVNGGFYSQDRDAPYSKTFTPTEVGTYTIGAKAFDDDGVATEKSVTITVVNPKPKDCAGVSGGTATTVCGICVGGTTGKTAPDADGDGIIDCDDECPNDANNKCNDPINQSPVVSFTKPVHGDSYDEGTTLVANVTATDDGSIAGVKLFINGTLVREEKVSTYDWNHKGQDPALQNMAAGTYVLRAVATDNEGAESTTEITITIEKDVVTSNDPIIGDDCSVKNGTANFELNSEIVSNSREISWWFSGSSSSVISPANAPHTTEVTMSQYYKGGEVCAGVNLNAAPWYETYCKSVGVCSDAEPMQVEGIEVNEYPNPVDGNSITVEVNEEAGEIISVELLDGSGEVRLSTSELTNGQIDLSNIPSGSYILRVVTENGVANKRVVKL